MTYEINFAELLEQAVKEPGIISEAYSQFHNYSLNNVMLVATQCHIRDLDFGPIAGYKAWQDLGRQVQAGQKGMYIIHPVIVSKEVEVENESGDLETVKRQTLVGFKPKKTAFVLSQTDGEDVDFEATVGEFDFSRLWDTFQVELVDTFDAPNGNVMGYTDGTKIAVNPVNPHPEKTMIHEIAHFLMKHAGENAENQDLDTHVKEVEAESVAFIITTVLNLDGQAESRGYIQNWLGKADLTEESAQRIIATANKILKVGTAKGQDKD